MLDPNSSAPPPPDLQCSIDGVSHYFELGEVYQENIARASALRTRQLITNAQSPLLTMWPPLESMLAKKLNKIYNSEARPVSLLLYYDRSPAFWHLQQSTIASQAIEIQTIFESSVFDSLCLFDATKGELLFQFARYSSPFIKKP
jgi:hypothetical protein